MKKLSIAGMVLMLAGLSQATLIYSNNFSGTEFKVAGVGVGVAGNMVESGGRLTPISNNVSTVGFRVDLSTLGLATDLNVTAVKLTIAGKSPLTSDGSGYIGLAFQDIANYNVNGNGNPVIAITGSGIFRAAGGTGFATNVVANVTQGSNFTSGGEFTMSLQYNKNGTIDTWYNGVQVHTNQVIATTDAIELKNAVIAFRGLAFVNGANIDTFTIETIPEPATIGMLGLGALLVLFVRKQLRK